VAIGPGLTTLIRTPPAMASRAAALERATTPALVAPYAPSPGTAVTPIEAAFTITPPPFARICAISCRSDSQTPVRFGAAPGHHDGRALTGERQCGGLADAGAAAGHQRGRPLDLHA
jgi:hypothetical protein